MEHTNRDARRFLGDAEELATELRRRIRGEVRFDLGSRALYSTDASNYRQVPIGVVIPRTVEDVVETVEVCRRFGAPILPRGAGTSQAGQCCNVAVVMDFSKYLNRVIDLDPQGRRARVEPGTILDDLRNAAERHALTFGPDPSTHNRCTLGGMIGNNSCGVHSVMAGNTVDNVEELEVLTYDGLRLRVGPTREQDLDTIIQAGGRRGQIYAGLKSLRDRYAELIRDRYPRIPRRVSGYNLDQLLPEKGFNVARALVGTEGSCVTVLEATLRLVPSPPGRTLLVLGFPDIFRASDEVMEVMAHGPIGLEGLDDRLVEYMHRKRILLDNVALLPEGDGWFLVEFGGETQADANDRAREAMDRLGRRGTVTGMKVFADRAGRQMMLALRESGFGASAHVPGMRNTWPGWEDSAVAPERLGDYLRELRRLLDGYGYHGGFYGHYGQGCVHALIDFDLATAEGISKFRSFLQEGADLVVRYGGSLSGEHGDGQARAELLPKMFGDDLVGAFREFKGLWDPVGKMNPGKVVDPYQADENLRLGADYRPWRPKTHFRFPEEDGSFAEASLRCVGVGKCRRLDGGTMCPSFMATREERFSTRGRARLLFEMLRGDVITGGWRDERVKESLDLCLACKGCKGDCPVNVDMATYKAEFLSHYYEGRLRPRSAYVFGLIMYWARLASRAPGVANFFTQTPLLRDLAKVAAGIAPERSIPAFASQTFEQWFRKRAPRNHGMPRVILWPDTFNNHFDPEVGRAAVEVLEAAGFQVVLPKSDLCCGRPLYDYGMLGLARRLLERVMDALGPDIDAGVPVVGLEPSCLSVFRDELPALFPEEERAARLSRQSYLLGEFLEREAGGFRMPRLERKAVVHGHCHHKSIMQMGHDEALLDRLGLEFTLLDSGCCGMAGPFGFEKGHYELSVQIGERVLLPAVRSAPRDSLIVADGFSCREQIAQCTDRRALHLAQVIQMALRQG
ncbi:MAG: FAD-binding and (Fe-S)-binding domain-containing protein [Sphingomonadaceae bacterium]